MKILHKQSLVTNKNEFWLLRWCKIHLVHFLKFLKFDDIELFDNILIDSVVELLINFSSYFSSFKSL